MIIYEINPKLISVKGKVVTHYHYDGRVLYQGTDYIWRRYSIRGFLHWLYIHKEIKSQYIWELRRYKECQLRELKNGNITDEILKDIELELFDLQLACEGITPKRNYSVWYDRMRAFDLGLSSERK